MSRMIRARRCRSSGFLVRRSGIFGQLVSKLDALRGLITHVMISTNSSDDAMLRMLFMRMGRLSAPGR